MLLMSPGDTILFRMENIVLVTLKNNKDHLGHYLRVILCILNRLFAFKDSRSDVGMSCLACLVHKATHTGGI